MRTNLDYQLNTHHSFNLNYHLRRTGNDRFDDLDTSCEPSKDVVTKHILGLSYNPVSYTHLINPHENLQG